MLRDRDDRVADEHEMQAVDQHPGVALEILEQLRAPFVLVNPADVDGKSIPHVELLAEPYGIALWRYLRPHADDDAGDGGVVGDRLDERTFLERVVHEGPDAAKHGREHRQAERAVTLRGRDEDGFRGDGPDAVIGVVVAETEEDEEVELRLVVTDVLDERRARRSLGFEPRQFVRQRVGRREHLM
jgi:hypothetical protein